MGLTLKRIWWVDTSRAALCLAQDPTQSFWWAALNQASLKAFVIFSTQIFSVLYKGERWHTMVYLIIHQVLSVESCTSDCTWLWAHGREPYIQLLPSRCLAETNGRCCHVDTKLWNTSMFHTLLGNLRKFQGAFSNNIYYHHVPLQPVSKGATAALLCRGIFSHTGPQQTYSVSFGLVFMACVWLPAVPSWFVNGT